MPPALDTATRDRLVQAAVKVFAERSYSDVSTRDLAKAADTALSAIGYHFGTKLDLYMAAARHVFDELAGPLALCVERHPLGSGEPGEVLEKFMDEVADVFLATGDGVLAGSRFSLRELSVGGPARPMIVERIVDPVVNHAAALLARATGRIDVTARIVTQATTLFGPITLYRLLHNHTLSDNDNADGAAACAAIRATIRTYARALVAGGGAG